VTVVVEAAAVAQRHIGTRLIALGQAWIEDPGAAAALDGRFGGTVSVPKKSNPSNESAGFVCFGGAASAFGGGLAGIGAAEFALGGGSISSPKRSGCWPLLT